MRAVVGSGGAAIAAEERLVAEVSAADYVFVTQYFVKGGAEKVILNYISALIELRPSLRIAIVTTDVAPNPTWIERMPESVQLIDGSAVVGDLRNRYRRQILGSVMGRMSPKVIHIVNSGVGYLWVRDEAKKLKASKVRIVASLFNSDMSKGGKIRSYYHKFLPAAADVIDQVFTDNEAVIDEAVKYTKLPRKMFEVHYQPIDLKIQKPRAIRHDKRLEVLWASRVVQQKRPDILRKIGRRLDPEKFLITIRGEMGDGYSEAYFGGIAAIKYGGEFKSVAELAAAKYDVFLYTSQADGVPNMLLEMMAEGMLIMAPDVGGVREIVSNKTGMLLPKFDDVGAYVAGLKKLERERADLRERILAGQKLLKERHSRKSFLADVKRDIVKQL